MTRIKICKEEGCHNAATTEGYCRLHYLKHWRGIKEESKKRAAKKLNRYIESVMRRHPDRYVDIIKKDIRSPSFNTSLFDEPQEGEAEEILGEPNYDEEVDKLIKQLKIEKGY